MWHNMILWFFWTLGSDWHRISNTSITVIFYNFFLMCPFTFLPSNYFEIYTVPLLITFTPLFLKTPELWLLSNNNVVPADWLFPLTHLYYSPWSLFYEINPDSSSEWQHTIHYFMSDRFHLKNVLQASS